MEYKILEIDQKRGDWVRIKVTFDDGEVYEKRMMADTSSLEGIDGSVKQWLADYLPLREQSKERVEVLPKKAIELTVNELPKSSQQIAAEEEQARLAREAEKAEEERRLLAEAIVKLRESRKKGGK